MSLPPLYKYLSVEGAEKTLGNRNFRFAKPSDFKYDNDDMDMTVQKLFPEGEMESLTIQNNSFTDIILRNLHRPPTCQDREMREQIVTLQEVYSKNPAAAKVVTDIRQKDKISDIYDIEHLRGTTQKTIADINEFLQGYRVLCVSQKNNSPKMWERYAQDHQGIAVRILPSPNPLLDSKFKLFREVKYQAERPTLYSSTLTFMEDSLFEDQEEMHRKIIENIIYTKTKGWEYEHEYRLVTVMPPHKDWKELAYHPEELSELYLGKDITPENRDRFIKLAKRINPNIAIFQMKMDSEGRITPHEILHFSN